MADIMGHISNTNHVVDNTTIGIPVHEKMLIGSAELDIYGQIAKLTNRVEELARNIAAIEGKLDGGEYRFGWNKPKTGENQRNRKNFFPETHEW